MKNIIFKFLLNLTLCTICVANTSIAQSAEVVPQRNYQQLEKQFEIAEVAPQQLEAFEQRGVQKLNDLASYLENISDQQLDSTFRKQAELLALQLFVADDVSFKYLQDGKTIDTTIKKYLSHLLSQKEEKINFQFLNISKISDMEKNEDGNYSWLLQYVEKQSRESETSNAIITLRVTLKKIEKQFGTQRRWIWEVLLDEMKSLSPTP